METNKLSVKDWKRIVLGAIQIAVITSLGLYYLCASSYNIFVLCAVPITIGIISGLAVAGRSIKEAVLKWTFSIPLWWIAVILTAKSEINRRIAVQLTGYDDLTVGDGLGYMLATMFTMFWALVFLGTGVWYSGHREKNEKYRKILSVTQAVPINIVCAMLIIGHIILNIVLPPYRAGMHYT